LDDSHSSSIIVATTGKATKGKALNAREKVNWGRGIFFDPGRRDDKLSAGGLSRVIAAPSPENGWRWIVDAHREGRRYIVHSDELLSAFLEFERLTILQ
jgi:hypothetical protein